MNQSEPTEKKLRRNNSKHPLTLNGSRRNGQFEWHNAECQIEDYGIKYDKEYSRAYRLIWCATHGQWAIERPKTVVVVYTFEDGTEVKRNI